MALRYVVETAKSVNEVSHRAYGECEIISVDEKYLRIKTAKTGEEKQLSLSIVVANGIVNFDVEGFADNVKELLPLLKNADSIPRNLEFTAHALAPYEEYLD